jgi:hypothetical protein
MAMMIQRMAARQFRSKIANRDKNPQTAPVAVKKCTLQAKVFFICSGSLSNMVHLSDKVQQLQL